MMLIAIVAAFAIFFFLGWVQSHWIAPAVLYVVSVPLVLESMGSGPVLELLAALLGVVALYYASFALGRFAGARSSLSDGVRS